MMLLTSIVFGAVLYFFNGVPVGVGLLLIVMLLLFSWLLILTSRKDNLAIRNLIESNIFNILTVLGVTAAIKEINIIDAKIFTLGYMWMIAITLVVGLFIVYLF